MIQGANPSSSPLRVRIGPGDLALETPGEVLLRLDAEGRWCSFRPGSALHRRTLNGDVVVHDSRSVRILSDNTADDLHETVAHLATSLADKIESRSVEVALQGCGARKALLLDRLRTAADWTPARYGLEKDRFADAYPEPVFILPPDRYRDVVLLPAQGCPHGKCSFCAFYKGRGFRILGSAEFEYHLAAVQRFFGQAIHARKGVFLGSASALSLPQPALLGVLEKVNRSLGPRTRSIAAFQDPDHSPRRTPEDYRALLEAGLDFITVGLETGLPSLRKALGKSASVERVLETVVHHKNVNMHCGVTVLVGAGGRAAAPDHLTATAGVLSKMPLDSRDHVYLSPLKDPLLPADLEMEFGRFREGVARVTPARIVPYHIDRYQYFS